MKFAFFFILCYLVLFMVIYPPNKVVLSTPSPSLSIRVFPEWGFLKGIGNILPSNLRFPSNLRRVWFSWYRPGPPPHFHNLLLSFPIWTLLSVQSSSVQWEEQPQFSAFTDWDYSSYDGRNSKKEIL